MRTPIITCAMLIAFLSCITSTKGEGIEAIAAKGPSSRDVSRESAYSREASANSNNTTTVAPKPAADVSSSDKTNSNGRLLRFGHSGDGSSENSSSNSSQRSRQLLSGLTGSSTTTAIAALAFVVGLFFLFAWLMKRGMPKSSRTLPTEAVRVLGRIPLAARQFGHLLHIGNKLVLVSESASGIEKLAEIDDPQEVERLLSICSDNAKSGSQKEFKEVFGQFAKEPAGKGFLGNEAPLFSGNAAAEAYSQAAGGGRNA